MTVNETTSISDLHRQHLIQEINAFTAKVASVAADSLSLDNIEAATASQGGNSAANITAAATTLIKTGAGSLHVVNVNSLGTVASTVKIYDGTSAAGTLLATINSLSISGSFTYDIAFIVGLCIVTTGTVAPDVTVVYK